MSIGRRGFLGMAAAAPIAGPNIAKQAMQAMTTDVAAKASHGLIGSAGGLNHAATRASDPMDIVRRAHKAGLLSDDDILQALAGQALPRGYNLDPDLQAARSFSLSARMQMQADRDKRKQLAQFLNPRAFVGSTWDLVDICRTKFGLTDG